MIPNKRQCFVMMPSGNHGEYEHGKEEADFIYSAIIVPSIAEVFGPATKIIREADNRIPGAVNKAIIEHIAESDLAIVDITGQNPNVFLELGIRYSLRRSTTVLLRQKGTVIPFDISNFRSIEYVPRFAGIEKAKQELTGTLQDIHTQPDLKSDSLVFEALPELTVNLPNSARDVGSYVRTMPWEVYWARLQVIRDRLQSVFKDGRYNPSIIVGITNGGAMFADLLVREIFEGGRPAIALWADRHNAAGNYFENKLNEAIVNGIQGFASEREGEVKILLVDDIVASGQTVLRAIEFLVNKLLDTTLQFLPLFSRNDSVFGLIDQYILWKDPSFRLSDEDARALHSTGWHVLPYKKDIRAA